MIVPNEKANPEHLSVPPSPYTGSTSPHSRSSAPSSPYGSPRQDVGSSQYPPHTYGDDLPPPYEGSSSSRSTPGAGPSSSPSFLERLRSSGGATPAEILGNLPPAFSRAPPSNVPYAPFPACALVSLSHELDKGFPALPPPTLVQPHPFALHDVQEEDWVRFINDIKRAGTLSPMNHVVAGVAPLAMGIGPLGILVSRGITKSMKRKKVGPVTEIIEHWNYYFFYPRQMEITLFQGDHPQSAPTRASSVSSSSSSSDSSDAEQYTSRRQRKDARRMEKRARRAERCQEKTLRRERRREQKMVRKEKWQLVVSYKPSNQHLGVAM